MTAMILIKYVHKNSIKALGNILQQINLVRWDSLHHLKNRHRIFSRISLLVLAFTNQVFKLTTAKDVVGALKIIKKYPGVVNTRIDTKKINGTDPKDSLENQAH